MVFQLFRKEEAVIAEGNALLESGAIADDNSAQQFEALLKAYQKLHRSSQKLMRLSDRGEAELNALAKTLDEKNSMLQELSGKLSKYLSPQVYESIFSGRSDVSLETKRKKLTVFFSDIKDFTSTTEDLEPEDLTYLLNSYFSEMSQIALKYGATIDKFIGDAMVMFFGDPETKGVKEDATACVLMAIEMQQKMNELQDVWRDEGHQKPFFMRIGLNTGYCNVGNFGSDERMDYTIIGGEVNLAARLESQADSGGILMSYETYALVRDTVPTEERDPITVKGIKGEVRPFAVTGILSGDLSERFTRKECDGMLLVIDHNRIGDNERKVALKELKSAIDLLEK